MTDYNGMVVLEYTRHKMLANYANAPHLAVHEAESVMLEHKRALTDQQGAHADHIARLDQAAQQRHEELMATLTRPKTIIRDADGRISGVK